MCGILGITHPAECTPELFDRMLDAMERRGPDARGARRDELVALGHRRLSILDLSERGAQPMATDDEKIHIVYNGECYNHLELRNLLPGIEWKSDCDTETILRLYEAKGPAFVRLLVGMFAIAIYDKRRRQLLLYRDRMGEKPLYYYEHAGRFLFSSEIKPLLMHPEFDRTLNKEAIREYLVYNYIPAPHTIFRHLKKLPPGTMLRYSLDHGGVSPVPYWSVRDHTQRGVAGKDGVPRTPREAVDQLEELILGAVRGQTLSDVPLGCFLSGGIDSSTIAWALSKASAGQAKTFSIGFKEAEFNEAHHARKVAKALGTEHHERIVTADDCLPLMQELPGICGEPFADASILPSILLARHAREHVTVALSGDGGDELFLGYDRYRWAQVVQSRMGFVPDELRRPVARMLALLPHYRLRVMARAMQYKSDIDIYPWLLAGWNVQQANDLMAQPSRVSPLERVLKQHRQGGKLGSLRAASVLDLEHYLPDDILFKVDRSTMAASLESRVPLLDHRLVEFAMKLPAAWNMNKDRQKLLLKQVLYRHVDKRIFERPKAGFAVPLRHWFRGPLLPVLKRELSRKALDQHGLFNERSVRELIEKHQSGHWNFERPLFALLVFQLWYRQNFA